MKFGMPSGLFPSSRNQRGFINLGSVWRDIGVVFIFCTIFLQSLAYADMAQEALSVDVVRDFCQSGVPEVQHIRNASDWLEFVGDRGKHHACFWPGDYRDIGQLELKAVDGRARQQYLVGVASFQRPDDFDVWSAKVPTLTGIDFGNASGWVVSGLRFRGHTSSAEPVVHFSAGAQQNLFALNIVEEGAQGSALVVLSQGAVGNVLRSNIVRSSSPKPGIDSHCVLINGAKSTQLIKNEIYNCAGDGIQLGLLGGLGTVVENNDIYLTSSMYTDCFGVAKPDGACACAENGLDIKATAVRDNATRANSPWASFIGNRVWGFRKTDTLCGGSGDSGNAITIHWEHSDNILFASNYVAESDRGLNVAEFNREATSTGDGTQYVSISGNTFHSIRRAFGDAVALVVRKSSDYSIESNLFYDNDIDVVFGAAPGTRNRFASNYFFGNALMQGRWGNESVSSDNRELQRWSDLPSDWHPCYFRKLITSPESVCVGPRAQ